MKLKAPSYNPLYRKPPPPEGRRLRDEVFVNPTSEHRLLTGALVTRAAEARGNFDEDGFSIDAIVATATPVMRRDASGPYAEVLDPTAFRLPGEDVPLIDEHQRGSARHVIGRAFNFRLEDGNVVATLRFSMADDVDPIVQRVRDGTLKHFSIGYRVAAWRDGTEGGRRTRTATDWQIQEVSIVGQPADPNARRLRAMEPDELIEVTETTMPEADAQRIRSLGELADLPPSVADGLITRGVTVDEARTEIRSALIERSRSTPRIRVVSPAAEDPAVIVRRQTDALAYRMAGGELPEDARPLVDVPLRDMAAASLQRAGVSTRGMSTSEMLYRAGEHTTSDFSLTVSNAMNKVALDGYKAAESPLKTLCRQRSLPNFKESTPIRLGEMGRLEPLTESGEFRATSRGEHGETLKLGTYGRSFAVSRQLLIDDDLGLLGDITRAIGEAAAQTEADLLVEQVTGNPKLSDGAAVFHASRGNIGTAGDITVAALTEARQALRTRTGIDGKTLISATPKYLLVGADRETEAETVLAGLYASTVGDVNPFSGKLTLLVEPRITDGSWFVFADPARLAGLQFAYLSSAQGVQIQRSEAWDVLGSKWRAWLDFGAGWVDWRAAQFNAGA